VCVCVLQRKCGGIGNVFLFVLEREREEEELCVCVCVCVREKVWKNSECAYFFVCESE